MATGRRASRARDFMPRNNIGDPRRRRKSQSGGPRLSKMEVPMTAFEPGPTWTYQTIAESVHYQAEDDRLLRIL